MIAEAHGIPLAVSLTGGNRNDVTQLMPLVRKTGITPVIARRGTGHGSGLGTHRRRFAVIVCSWSRKTRLNHTR